MVNDVEWLVILDVKELEWEIVSYDISSLTTRKESCLIYLHMHSLLSFSSSSDHSPNQEAHDPKGSEVTMHHGHLLGGSLALCIGIWGIWPHDPSSMQLQQGARGGGTISLWCNARWTGQGL